MYYFSQSCEQVKASLFLTLVETFAGVLVSYPISTDTVADTEASARKETPDSTVTEMPVVTLNVVDSDCDTPVVTVFETV